MRGDCSRGKVRVEGHGDRNELLVSEETCSGFHGSLGLVQRELVTDELVESRIGLQVPRRPVVPGTARPEPSTNGDLLQNDEIREQLVHRPHSLQRCDNDVAAGANEVQCRVESIRIVFRHVQHDLRSSAETVSDGAGDISFASIDDHVCPEFLGEPEAVTIFGESAHTDPPCAGFLGRDQRCEPSGSGTEDHDRVFGAQRRDLDSPGEPFCERVTERGNRRFYVIGNRVKPGTRVQVEVLGESSPQTRGFRGGQTAIRVDRPAERA
jgi:hypothetical protein